MPKMLKRTNSVDIMLNGESRTIHSGENLAGLVKKLRPGRQRVASLLNGELIPADKRAKSILKEGDRVELLTFAGGG